MDIKIAPTITACIMSAVKNNPSTVQRRFWDFDQWCELEVTRTAEPQHGALWTFEAFVTVNNQKGRILYTVGNADGFTNNGIDLSIEMSSAAVAGYKRLSKETKALIRDNEMLRRFAK